MSDPRAEIRRSVTGYALALALTCAAFALVHWRWFGVGTTLALIFGLGLVQMLVHFRFFLHLGLEARSRDRLWLVLFSAVVISLMVAGTLVILFNLRGRMM